MNEPGMMSIILPRVVDPQSPTFKYVMEFACDMEKKLSLNRHKGDREGWINDHPKALLNRLKEEVKELELAIEVDHMGGVIAEAADVGNFAMMIADIARTLKSVKGPGEFAELPPMMVHNTSPNDAISEEQLLAKHIIEDRVHFVEPDYSDIPLAVTDAARLLENFFKSKGITNWELMGVASRISETVAVKWVGVDEAVPNSDQTVLCLYAEGLGCVRFWRDAEGGPHFGLGANEKMKPTHWMPIPEFNSPHWRKVPEV